MMHNAPATTHETITATGTIGATESNTADTAPTVDIAVVTTESEMESETDELTDAELDEIISELTATAQTLQQEIDTIGSEMARCKKSQNTAKALTIVGALGVLGTGIGAAVQGTQIKSAKKEQENKDNDK